MQTTLHTVVTQHLEPGVPNCILLPAFPDGVLFKLRIEDLDASDAGWTAMLLCRPRPCGDDGSSSGIEQDELFEVVDSADLAAATSTNVVKWFGDQRFSTVGTSPVGRPRSLSLLVTPAGDGSPREFAVVIGVLSME